ncbi:MAG: SulP family inorganic anion transporter [Anaerolineales bacterium]
MPFDFFRDMLGFLSRPAQILRSYSKMNLRPDLIAGLTIAVVLLPQAISNALIAELPLQMGLYAAIVAAIVGALWGSSVHLHTGPTNAASLLVLSTLVSVAAPGSPEYLAAAGLMAIMVGVIRLAMGLARLGVLVNFVSDSVVIGFTAGAGILISMNQMSHLLRLSIPSSPSLFVTVAEISRNLSDVHWISLLLGLGTILVMGLVKVFNPKWPAALIGMMVAAVVVAALGLDQEGALVLGKLPRSLPPLARIPIFDIKLIGQILAGVLAVSAIGLVEATSIARSIAAQSGQKLDSNQEFVGQGLANIAAGVFSGYACSGSFIRSAVNFVAGGRTPLANVFSGFWVLLALLLFAPLTAFLPRAALAGALILTAYGMVDRKEMRRIWHASRGDSVIMIATLLATLIFPLEYAVLSGIIVSFLRYIVKTSMPAVHPVVPDASFRHFVRLDERPTCLQLGIITVGGSLYFGATQHVENSIRENLEKNPGQRYLLLRMHMVDHCDVSGIHTLESIVRLYRKQGGDVFLSAVRKPLTKQMRMIGFDRYLGADHFLTREDAISHLFHDVMNPSVCIYECHERVFAECQALPKHPLTLKLPALSGIQEQGIQHWLPSVLKLRLDEGDAIVLVDVREPDEYEKGHILDARLLPLRLMMSHLTRREQGASLPADRRIVLVCRSGRRSHLAAYILQDMGYTRVCNLQGGMLAWEAAGYPVAVE